MKLAAKPKHCFSRLLYTDRKIGAFECVFIPVGWKSIGAFRLVCEVLVNSFHCSYSWVFFPHLAFKDFLNFNGCLLDWKEKLTFEHWDKFSFILNKENKILLRDLRTSFFFLKSSHAQPGGWEPTGGMHRELMFYFRANFAGINFLVNAFAFWNN